MKYTGRDCDVVVGVGGHRYHPNRQGQYVWRAFSASRAYDRREKGKHGRRETARERRAYRRVRARARDRLARAEATW